jgi:hypothetical protein
MEIEALKLVAYQGGGVVGVIAVCLIFIRAIDRLSTRFTESNTENQKAHREEVARLVDDHVTLTRETVKAVGRLDATVRSVERTVMGVEQTVGDLKTVVTILSRDREREQEAKEGKA